MQNIYKIYQLMKKDLFLSQNKNYQESGIYYNNLHTNSNPEKNFSELTKEIRELKTLLKSQNR